MKRREWMTGRFPEMVRFWNQINISDKEEEVEPEVSMSSLYQQKQGGQEKGQVREKVSWLHFQAQMWSVRWALLHLTCDWVPKCHWEEKYDYQLELSDCTQNWVLTSLMFSPSLKRQAIQYLDIASRLFILFHLFLFNIIYTSFIFILTLKLGNNECFWCA